MGSSLLRRDNVQVSVVNGLEHIILDGLDVRFDRVDSVHRPLADILSSPVLKSEK
jgi:hypothetical protein